MSDRKVAGIILSEMDAQKLTEQLNEELLQISNSSHNLQYHTVTIEKDGQAYEIEVRRILEEQLVKEGFLITQFTSNLVYPETFKHAIEAKNNAVQAALMAENKVKTAEAEAKIKIATAEGNAKAMLTQAKAESESNLLRQKTLTPLLLQQMWIEKWNGHLPTTQLGSGTNMMYNIK